MLRKKLIDKYFTKNSHILDIGCGCGRTSIPLKKLGYNVSAMDLSSAMISEAKRFAKSYNCEIDFKVMNACELEYSDSSFDFVLFSFNGFECVPGIECKIKALNEVKRVLKDDGIFIFSVHSGLPFNSMWHVYLYHFVKYLFDKIKINKKGIKYGERYDVIGVPESTYTHVISTFTWDRLIKKCGFTKIYFNSQNNIEKNKKSRFYTRFEEGNLYFVVKKTKAVTKKSLNG